MPMEVKEVKEKKKLKKRTIITYIVSFLCLILCLYITIEIISANNSKRPPNIFGVSISYVPTNSMEPTIHTGDYIMFTRVGFDDVKKNDIIIYRSEKNNMFIVHRVVGSGVEETGEKYLITKGDNNSIADTEHITKDMVCGRFVTTLSFMAIFKGGINTNIIFAILVVIFVVMIGMQVFSIVMKHKNDKLKEEQEKKKELLREELRREILAEEIAKIKEAQKKKDEPLDK